MIDTTVQFSRFGTCLFAGLGKTINAAFVGSLATWGRGFVGCVTEWLFFCMKLRKRRSYVLRRSARAYLGLVQRFTRWGSWVVKNRPCSEKKGKRRREKTAALTFVFLWWSLSSPASYPAIETVAIGMFILGVWGITLPGVFFLTRNRSITL